MSAFFSVCIPSKNRSKTIFNTLKSLALQTFKDFEVIVVDCASNDNTREIINSFFASPEYLGSNFNYRFILNENFPKTVEDWNEPVRHAQGKYIAMLEGDDQFLPNHLELAHQNLINKSNIGIYISNNQITKESFYGIIRSKEYFNLIYSLKKISPPSETIFIRSNNVGEAYNYNDKDFVYAPEIDLYLRIASDGFDCYYANHPTVIRHLEPKTRAKWRYYTDHFFVAKKYKNYPFLENNAYEKSIENIYTTATKFFIYDFFSYKSEDAKELKRKLIERDGWFNFNKYLIKSFWIILIQYLKKKLS